MPWRWWWQGGSESSQGVIQLPFTHPNRKFHFRQRVWWHCVPAWCRHLLAILYTLNKWAKKMNVTSWFGKNWPRCFCRATDWPQSLNTYKRAPFSVIVNHSPRLLLLSNILNQWAPFTTDFQRPGMTSARKLKMPSRGSLHKIIQTWKRPRVLHSNWQIWCK